MLKAIELTGFKSFADRTRLEFPPGITVVVGPNGSGKSNIVDAMKWVLGVQSATSLRGKAMADVIFKGSTVRKPANTAEATIFFDNVDNIFGLDAEEIQVTRRVYRSGEGEYLINGEACRLRDIKDMFRGTGVGVDGYSLIEQGKVGNLLKATPRDRRAIFEEAAGISRFKAKKVESQRRLERVDQNLLRLSDIVEEVDNRLRRLKSQAGKARRYKEHADRLQELRTQVGRVDWQSLTTKLAGLDTELLSLAGQIEQAVADVQAKEERSAVLDTEFTRLEEELGQLQSDSGRVREKLASRQSTVHADRLRVADFEDELARYSRQLLAMTSKADDLHSELRSVMAELKTARADHTAKAAESEQRQVELNEANQRLDQIREQSETRRNDYVARMRIAAELTNNIATHQSSIDASTAIRESVVQRMEDLQVAWTSADTDLNQLTERLATAETQQSDSESRLSTARNQYDESTISWEEARQQLIDLRQKRAVVGERVALLEDIEKRMEGIGSGVKKMLELVAVDQEGPLSAVRGMVADLMIVRNRADAEMVAVALGERAQHLVVAGTQLIDHLASGEFQVPGRVGFVRLQSTAPPRFLREVDLDDQVGVIGRADRFVQTETEYEHLAEWLLGDTWFVESLEDAVQFHRSLKAPPRFVTRAGEALDRDGRLLVGPITLELGLIPRRAELNALRRETADLDEKLAAAQAAEEQLGQELAVDEQQMEELNSQEEASRREMEKLRIQMQAAEGKVGELDRQRQELTAEIDAAEAETSAAQSLVSAGHDELANVNSMIATLELALAGDRDEVLQLEAQQKEVAAIATSAKVTFAKSEQRFDALQARCDQLQRDQDEREAALAEIRSQADRVEQRREQAELEILNVSATIAQLFIDEQHAESRAQAISENRDAFRAERARHNGDLKRLRDQLRNLEQEQHVRELDAERVRSDRGLLADRLREDYGIEVAELHHDGQLSLAEEQERGAVDQEIIDLRRKITNLGSVNMDALEELTDLESRHESLAGQYHDLVEAKETLERIIQKINADSRRLFTESLEAIRQNFQILFRKVFGGGNADLVLEDEVDILESGIDIVATPPGKTSFALSLLSGGEQALTAVTLLLAIFEYRPSPFCVLDEVDGPLDEANIGRFITVLHEFLDWTKFVVVTHSKKTMASANTLHGVTMQESGVSKRVSVRFEDVSDDGNISSNAISRSASDPDAA